MVTNVELSLTGGTGNELTSLNSTTLHSLSYGDGYLIEDSRNSVALGLENHIIDGETSMAFGEANSVGIRDFAIGGFNNLTSVSGFAFGVRNNLNNPGNYAFGNYTTINADDAMAIGFGGGSSNRLTNSNANSITIGIGR